MNVCMCNAMTTLVHNYMCLLHYCAVQFVDAVEAHSKKTLATDETLSEEVHKVLENEGA